MKLISNRLRRHLYIGMVAALAAVTTSTVGSPPIYRVTELRTPEGESCRQGTFALSDAGHIAGSCRNRAVLWNNGEVIDLGTLGRDSSAAYDVNNAGQVVGMAYDEDGQRRAFLWLPEPVYGLQAGMNDLEDLWKLHATATDINDQGHIVAKTYDRQYVWLPQPFGSLPAGLTDFLSIAPSGCLGDGYSISMNNSGQILGSDCLWLPEPAYGLSAGVHALAIPCVFPSWCDFGGHFAGYKELNDAGVLLIQRYINGWDICAWSAVVRSTSGLGAACIQDWYRDWDPDQDSDQWICGGIAGDPPPQGFDWVEAYDLNSSDPWIVGRGTSAWPQALGNGGSAITYSGDAAVRTSEGVSWFPIMSRTLMRDGLVALSPQTINNLNLIVGTCYHRYVQESRGCLLTPIDMDRDSDEDVDLDEFTAFRPCLFGPDVEASSECTTFDYDLTHRVDLADFQAIQIGFTGSD